MSTRNQASIVVPRCRYLDCDETPKVYPNTPASRFCPRHESERVQKYKAVRRVDPVTGREMTGGQLASLQWKRKKQAEKLAQAEAES